MSHAVANPLGFAGVRTDFDRARRAYLAARIGRLVRDHRLSRTQPRDLDDVAALFWDSTRLRSIPLEEIVGTVDATADFDAGFRPATERVSSRWQSVAQAYRDGRSLPPIAVIQRPDGYYVLDGRHRVSVARTLGHDRIDAWASRSLPRPTSAPSIKETAMSHLIHDVLSTVRRTLRPTECVHFHAGDDGRPYVCENARCTSPALGSAHD